VQLLSSGGPRLDRRRHRLLDLRVPAIAQLRRRSPARFARLLAALRADYLLLEVPLGEAPVLEGSEPVTWSAPGVRLIRLVR
jgi:hypothetical protein